jgi:hypothetical protein
MALELFPEIIVFVLFGKVDQRGFLVFVEAEWAFEFIHLLSQPFHCSFALLQILAELFFVRPLLPNCLNFPNRSINSNFISKNKSFFLIFDFTDLMPLDTDKYLPIRFPAA